MYQKNKPLVKPALKPIDHYINVLSWVLLVVLLVIPLAYWTELPNSLPTHFNFRGTPDCFGTKVSVWTLPILGTVLLSLLSLLNKVPHLFNYPVEITMQNASRLYALGIRMMGLIKLVLVVWLNAINFKSIQIGLGKTHELGSGYMPVFVCILLFLIVIFMVKSKRLK
jgi:uncharacterized membrane protein